MKLRKVKFRRAVLERMSKDQREQVKQWLWTVFPMGWIEVTYIYDDQSRDEISIGPSRQNEVVR